MLSVASPRSTAVLVPIQLLLDMTRMTLPMMICQYLSICQYVKLIAIAPLYPSSSFSLSCPSTGLKFDWDCRSMPVKITASTLPLPRHHCYNNRALNYLHFQHYITAITILLPHTIIRALQQFSSLPLPRNHCYNNRENNHLHLQYHTA